MSKDYKTKNYDPDKSREYYKQNSEYIIKRQKEYNRINAIERSIYFQEHYLRNKERILERCKAYSKRIKAKPKNPQEQIIEIQPSVVMTKKNVIIIFD
jgi:hypothetical protein